MSSNRDQGDSFAPLRMDSMNPLAILVPVAIVALTLLVLSRRRDKSTVAEAASSARDAQSDTTRKLMLTFAINALENDWMRRAVIMGLKIARNRM